jgi:hypothetical protein
MPSTTAKTIRFPVVSRQIVDGPDASYTIELSIIPREDGSTWLVLRDCQEPTRKSLGPRLTGSFEYVATILRYEQVFLKNRADALKFFHARAEMAPTGTLRWGFQEVCLLLSRDQYVFAKWMPTHPDTLETIIESLSSWGPPQRTTPENLG